MLSYPRRVLPTLLAFSLSVVSSTAALAQGPLKQGPPPPPDISDDWDPSVTNLGVTMNQGAPLRNRDWVAFWSREDMGGDQNGDGDSNDHVERLLNLETQQLVSPGFALGALDRPIGGKAAFLVDEASHFDLDLNGDGDENDRVLHTIDLATQAVVNHGVAAASGPRAVGSHYLLSIYESELGADVNGDGDQFDQILHTFDPNTGTLTDLPGEGYIVAPYNDFVLRTWAFAYQIESTDDLNGDGDTNDRIASVYDGETNQVTQLGLTVPSQSGTGAHYMNDSQIVFLVSESESGGIDLNGDGDAIDAVIHIYDRASTTATNTLLASGQSQHPFRVVLDGDLLGLVVPEFSQLPGTDYNGDGDSADWVVFAGSVSAGTLTSLGRSSWVPLRYDGRPTLAASGGHLFFRAHEPSDGSTDYNGDGDMQDNVLHAYDSGTDTLHNLAVASQTDLLYPWEAGSGRIATVVSEVAQGNTDLNGDGDAEDRVVHVYDTQKQQLTNLGLAGWPVDLDGANIAFWVFESQQGDTDFNGDGDALDAVLHVVNADLGEQWNLEVSLNGTLGPSFFDKVLVFAVRESSQGADLNGDGDMNDWIAHVTNRFP